MTLLSKWWKLAPRKLTRLHANTAALFMQGFLDGYLDKADFTLVICCFRLHKVVLITFHYSYMVIVIIASTKGLCACIRRVFSQVLYVKGKGGMAFLRKDTELSFSLFMPQKSKLYDRGGSCRCRRYIQ